MTNKTKGRIIEAIALFIDVSVPLAATFSQFPMWVDKSAKATASGLFVVFALLSVIPFITKIKEYMKSPAAWVMWLILFIGVTVLESIITEMGVICTWGLLANVIGAIIHKTGEKISKKEE